MRPQTSKSDQSLKIVIYAQNGILAGDLAALLSGQNSVDRQTSLPGVLNALNSQTDVLLLVGNGFKASLPDPSPILSAAKKAHCKVLMVGQWPGNWQQQKWDDNLGSLTILEEIPPPAVLFEVIGATTGDLD